MQLENSPSQQPAVVGQVLDLIRLLRLAYSPAMIGAQASVQVQHALDVLGGEVVRLGDEEGRPVPRRLALVPKEAVAAAGSALASVTVSAPSTGEAPPTQSVAKAMAPADGEATPTKAAPNATDHIDALTSGPPAALGVPRATDTTDGSGESSTLLREEASPADAAADAQTRAPRPTPEPPDLGNEPREDVGRAFRSALLADLARRSTRSASTPPAPRTGPHETTTCPASDASASTTPVRTAMPAS
jgi:hypothetical protein